MSTQTPEPTSILGIHRSSPGDVYEYRHAIIEKRGPTLRRRGTPEDYIVYTAWRILEPNTLKPRTHGPYVGWQRPAAEAAQKLANHTLVDNPSAPPREPAHVTSSVCIIVTGTAPLSFEDTSALAVAAKDCVPGAVGVYVATGGATA
jgi:hypothetical protein